MCNPIAVCMDLKNGLGKWECYSMFPVSLSPSLQTVNFPATSCGNIAERKIASDFRFVDFSKSLLEHLGHQCHRQRWEGAKRIESIPGTYSKVCQVPKELGTVTENPTDLYFGLLNFHFRFSNPPINATNIGVIST